LEEKKTEPNRTEINRFEPAVFGSVQKNFKKIGLVVYFGSKPDQTGNAQPYYKHCSYEV